MIAQGIEMFPTILFVFTIHDVCLQLDEQFARSLPQVCASNLRLDRRTCGGMTHTLVVAGFDCTDNPLPNIPAGQGRLVGVVIGHDVVQYVRSEGLELEDNLAVLSRFLENGLGGDFASSSLARRSGTRRGLGTATRTRFPVGS
jgi:hypothetical protein